ncbi:hypothetical protein M405DRAFT_413886 [Rhizopogon salebrosus TDB-379]|nr:hypothetical protein M405DRAFT_413886 [Rhizopogon salebrosus TDB-379]
MGSVEIEVRGLWLETILWEVPLMACISEIYFLYADQDWDCTGQEGEYSSIFMSVNISCAQNRPSIKPRVFSTHAVHSVIVGRVVEDLFLRNDLVLNGIIKARMHTNGKMASLELVILFRDALQPQPNRDNGSRMVHGRCGNV